MAVKVDGKVLREINGEVVLPFGSEYTIFLKNNSSERVSVDVYIDGTDVLNGSSIIIEGKSSTELKRFLDVSKSMTTGNAFKFIEKTEKVEKHRGNKAEDGLLTVVYRFENKKMYTIDTVPYDYPVRWTYDSWNDRSFKNNEFINNDWNNYVTLSNNNVNSGILRGTHQTVTPTSGTTTAVNAATKGVQHTHYSQTVNTDVGITVPGSVTDQTFTRARHFSAINQPEYSMTLKLYGSVDGKVVEKPFVVKRNIKCITCGETCRQTAKFCHECGTCLDIF